MAFHGKKLKNYKYKLHNIHHSMYMYSCYYAFCKIQDANLTSNSDQVILVGAASKGIIQRNFQHNATVYKTPYAKNPFDAVTDEEIEYYKNAVERGAIGQLINNGFALKIIDCIIIKIYNIINNYR